MRTRFGSKIVTLGAIQDGGFVSVRLVHPDCDDRLRHIHISEFRTESDADEDSLQRLLTAYNAHLEAVNDS